MVSMTATGDKVRVRFAPAPTGYLHIGGARTALFNWLFARKHGGTFILRIEDTDESRTTEEMFESIIESLQWLGLTWDEGPLVGGAYGPYRQSQRTAFYREHAERLLRESKAYYCYCTPEELEARKTEALAKGEAPKYDGRCRTLTASQREAFERAGRKPSVRFRVPERDVVVEDLVRGTTTFPAETIGDFVLLRSDGTTSFHLANVVDDALMKVSHAIRGEDLYPNTPRHLLLYEAFGYTPPRFAHLSMILAPDRSKLSKRHGAVSAIEYRAMGYLAEALVNYLALLGWSPPDEQEIMDVAKLVESFSLERVSKSGAIFDVAKLNYINALKIRTLPLEQIVEETRRFFPAEKMPSSETLRGIVLLFRDNVERLAEFPEKARAILSPPEYSAETIALAHANPASRQMLEIFSEEIASQAELSKSSLTALMRALSQKTGLRGKDLYTPIRLALMGEQHGPELVGIIAVLGKHECSRRARALAALM
jgi:nondiscriminating glutamyl-tRNA synthetase